MIAGGGIGGAVLALILGKAGKSVAILEKEIAPARIGRPEILALATFEIFDRLGAGRRLREESAIPIRGREIFLAGGELLHRYDSPDFQAENVQPFSVHPGKIREILIEEALRYPGVELFRGQEVTGMMRHKDRISGVRCLDGSQWPASLVVGDDGGYSRVREALGISLRARSFPLGFLAASLPEIPGGKTGYGQIWLRPEALGEKQGIFAALFIPQPGPLTSVIFLMTHGAWDHLREAPAEDFYREALRTSPRSAHLREKLSFPGDFFYHQRSYGHAECYGRDGAVLMGDAAHPVAPAGGQGANMAVADAQALGSAALEAFRLNDFSWNMLCAYEKTRRPANARSLRFSQWSGALLRSLQLVPAAAPLLIPAVIRLLDHNAFLRKRFIQGVSHAFESRASS